MAGAGWVAAGAAVQGKVDVDEDGPAVRAQTGDFGPPFLARSPHGAAWAVGDEGVDKWGR